MNNLRLMDIAGAYIEHSDVIMNFTAIVHRQIKASTCKKGNSFFDIPRFVMEVLSDSTRKYDRGEKMDIYRNMEIDEYWIVDWEKKEIEIYNLDYDENQEPQYHLF